MSDPNFLTTNLKGIRVSNHQLNESEKKKKIQNMPKSNS